MTTRIQIIIIVGALLAILYVFHLMKKKLINFKYGLGWCLAAFIIIVFAAFPVLLDRLSSLLGIELPINMLFFFGMILMGGLIFSLSKTVSNLSDSVKRLSQEIAIIRKDAYDATKDD